MNGRFGNPIHVDQFRLLIAMSFDPALQAAELKRFAAKYHIPQAQCVLFVQSFVGQDQLTKSRRRLIQHRHFVLRQQPIKRFGRSAYLVRHHHQSPAEKQRAPDFPNREIKRERVEQRPSIVMVKREPRLGGGKQSRRVGVRDLHTFGFSRRTRSVDDVGQLLIVQLHRRILVVC